MGKEDDNLSIVTKISTEKKHYTKLSTFLCSVDGRTSRRVLLDSWIVYPASLGVKALTFPSLIYNKQFNTPNQPQ